jgi:hypothetical protein
LNRVFRPLAIGSSASNLLEALLSKGLRSCVILFCEEEYEFKTEANSGWPIRPDYFVDFNRNCIPGIAKGRNARSESSSTACAGLSHRRLESSAFGLFHSFFARAVLKTAIGATLPTTITKKECDTSKVTLFVMRKQGKCEDSNGISYE